MSGKVAFVSKILRNESGISRCIESVLNQTYSNLVFYIFYSEATFDIIHKYAIKDERIVMRSIGEGVWDKTFSGIIKEIYLSGIEYYAVIDGDDWYEHDFVEKALNLLKEYQVDVVAAGYNVINESGLVEKCIKVENNFKAEIRQTEKWFVQGWSLLAMHWGIIFKTKLFVDYNEHSRPAYSEYGGRGGDTMVNFAVLPYAKSIGFLSECLYNYQQTSNSHSYKMEEGRLKYSKTLLHFLLNFMKKVKSEDLGSIYFLYTQYGNWVLENIFLVLCKEMTVQEKYEAIRFLLSNDENYILYNLTMQSRRDQFQGLYIKAIYQVGIFNEKELFELVKIIYPQIELFMDEQMKSRMQYDDVIKAKELLIDALLTR